MRYFLFLLSTLIPLTFINCGDDIISPSEQLQNDIAAIESYLNANNIAFESDPSGLRYVIHEQGTGQSIRSGNDVIRVGFEGRLLPSEEVFDSSEDAEFPLNALIIGWQIGVPLINEGGRITLYIPSGLGFGNQPVGSIPANSNLIFDIDLFEIN